jgi:hypothetical protein
MTACDIGQSRCDDLIAVTNRSVRTVHYPLSKLQQQVSDGRTCRTRLKIPRVMLANVLSVELRFSGRLFALG